MDKPYHITTKTNMLGRHGTKQQDTNYYVRIPILYKIEHKMHIQIQHPKHIFDISTYKIKKDTNNNWVIEFLAFRNILYNTGYYGNFKKVKHAVWANNVPKDLAIKDFRIIVRDQIKILFDFTYSFKK